MLFRSALYDIENIDVLGYDVVSNRPKVAAYRAPGAPITSFGVESALDDLAAEPGHIFPILFAGVAKAARGDRRRMLDDAHGLLPSTVLGKKASIAGAGAQNGRRVPVRPC